jgi:hypothetical protein
MVHAWSRTVNAAVTLAIAASLLGSNAVASAVSSFGDGALRFGSSGEDAVAANRLLKRPI